MQQIFSRDDAPNFVIIAGVLQYIGLLQKVFWSLFFWTQCTNAVKVEVLINRYRLAAISNIVATGHQGEAQLTCRRQCLKIS